MSDNKIDNVLKDHSKGFWVKKIKESKFAILFILILAGIMIYQSILPREVTVETINIEGKLLGVHQIQTITGSPDSKYSVQLITGQNVLLHQPGNIQFRKDARVIVTKSITDRGNVYYNFNRHVK